MDILSPEEVKQRAREEASYRRGYTQGFARALDLMDALIDEGSEVAGLNLLSAFFDGPVMSWRNSGDGFQPPSFFEWHQK